MEALYPVVVAGEEEEEEIEGGGRETTDEETDEDSEPEPPMVVRRKVSFADAFGLDLVSIKEFDNRRLVEPEDIQPPEVELIHPLEEFYMSCLFTVPSTPEELDERLEDQKVELESIELLPGTTTLRGIIRVVNLCYSKSVYVRITLDGWKSHFDLLAEYVPGSSDRKTDRFAFKYPLVPPFEREGTRVVFCLRYETSVGTFWANNKDLDYVLFCHQRAHAKEAKVNKQESQGQRESPNHSCKRSCLKANRRGCAGRTDKMAAIATDIPEAAATHKAEGADRKAMDSAEIHSLLHHEDHTPLVDSIRSRSRAARLARVQDFFTQRKQRELKAHSVDSANGLADSRPPRPYHHHHHQHQPLPTLWGSTSSLFRIRHKKHVDESPQILTYHQIPLLTLDWSSDKTQRSGTADVNDPWTGGTESASSKSSEDNMDNAPSVSKLWEDFLNGTDENMDDKISVCDIWQAFLNGGPDCKDHSGIPESEWLQTAASVSPSNHKTEPRTQCAITESRHTFQTDTDTPAPTHRDTHALAEWQLVSRDHVTLLVETAFNTEEQQPAETHIASLRDDNAVVCDASQKSEASCVTDTHRECVPLGAAHVSKGSVDSRTRWYKQAVLGREKKGGIGGGGGDGEGEEPFTRCIAESVTSSGETGTVEMTATVESQNASAVDRISQGVRPDRGLFYRGEGEVTDTAHNAMDDTVAFRETIREETEDGEGDVLFTSGQGEEERFTLNYTDKEVYTEGEIFRPQQKEEAQISQRYTDEKKCEEFRLNRNSEDALKRYTKNKDEIRLEQSHTDTLKQNQTHNDEFRQSQTGADAFKSDDSKQDEVVSNYTELEEFRRGQTEEDVSHGVTGQETNGKGFESNQAMGRYAWLNDEKGLHVNPTDTDLNRQKEDKLVFPKTKQKESGLMRTDKEVHIGSEKQEEDLTQMIQTEENVELRVGEMEEYELISYQTEVGTSQRHDGIINKEPEPCREICINRINISVQTQEEVLREKQSVESIENKEASKPDHDEDEFRPTEIDDECALEPNPVEMVELRWNETRNVKSEKEDLDSAISPREDAGTEKVSDFKPQRPREVLEAVGEDESQRDKDRVSIGKLETEVMEELMEDAGSTQEARKNVSTAMKEAQEVSMGKVESPEQAEYKKLPVRTEDPIIADDIVALQSEIGLGVEEAFTESTDPDLDEGILEQMLELKDDVCEKGRAFVGVEMGDRLSDISDLIHDIHLKEADGLSEEGLTEAFDSGVFSLTEVLTNPNLTLILNEGLGQNEATTSDKHSMTQSSQSLTNIAQTLSYPVTSSCFAPAKAGTTESQLPPSLTQNSPSLAEDQDSFRQIRERSVTHQQISEDCAVSQLESFSHLSPPAYQESCSSSSEKLDNCSTSVLVWWTLFYSLGHVTRTLAYALLVAVFFVSTFLYDFPACFALQAFAVCWWGYQWKKHRVTVTEGIVR